MRNLAVAVLGACLLAAAPGLPVAAPAAPGASGPAVPADGPPPAAGGRFAFVLNGNPAGYAAAHPTGPGRWHLTFDYQERGRGPLLETDLTLDEAGLPLHLETTGYDYWRRPAGERFDLAGGRASWQNVAEHGSREVRGPAYYFSVNAPPPELWILARALLRAPAGQLPLLPSGEARIEKAGAVTGGAGGKTRTAELYAISGLGFTPAYVWLDARQEMVAVLNGWERTVALGWEDAVPELVKAQDEAEVALRRTLATRLVRRPAGRLAFTGVKLFDAAARRVLPGMTVVVAGERIESVGRDADVSVPPGAEVVEGRGRTLLPGLWDMHVHLDPLDGLQDLAAGVTMVRDMGNDIDELIPRSRHFESGEEIGPRVLMAGFMDGRGPYSGPTKVLVSTEEEARAAVDRYAELGYVQTKIYSSIDPKLVPAIIERSRRHHLRVSGHIPYGLNAEQAVRLGFNEVQHANYLFLNFMDGVDTRTPARITAVAEHAAELDLGSERVRNFLRLLKDSNVAVDPTLNIFEALFTDRPGTISHRFAAVGDRLPPQFRRTLYAGGLVPPPGMDERYRDAFRCLLAMVRAVHDEGITIEAGTDATNGFSLHRELELYVEAGIPAPEVLYIATLSAARVMGRDRELGSVAPGKLADLILVDGDPAARISDIRRVALTVSRGRIYDPARLYQAIGVKPAV